MQVSVGCTWKGKPLKTWRKDPLDFQITDGHWEGCLAWRTKIYVDDPNNVGNEL